MRFSLIVLSLIVFSAFSQDQTDKIDVQLYGYYISVNDSNDQIEVNATALILFKKDVDDFYLDLTNKNSRGKGMSIDLMSGVKENEADVDYEHQNDKLTIHTRNGISGTTSTYQIKYKGIPENGLIIGENKFGSRTFFGDNWPNRAHNWLVCVDHPMEKAKVSFAVEAPKHYSCIATGKHMQSIDKETTKVHLYKSDVPLPPKVIVIGLADFATEQLALSHPFPLTSMVYVENEKVALRDLRVAPRVLDYFINTIAPFPYEKLANVQSTTMFGGMENAGNIFYDENAFTGKNEMEALIAHEIAHQWFGNSASESDWQHLWLSEGFATYFTDLYFEEIYGGTIFRERLVNERNKVIAFSKKYDHPVIDTTYESLMVLLNPNSYQKGAWVLHMLREKLGNDLFMKGIKDYYEKYKFSNASSSDFEAIMQSRTPEDLGPFFDQWLRIAGHPVLDAKQKSKKKKFSFSIEQKQSGATFEFPLDVQFNYEDGTTDVKTYYISTKRFDATVKSKKKITSITLDPSVRLLYELDK